MAAHYNNHMTEVGDDDRFSSVSVATTCFGGFDDNIHVNELRAMRKAINVYRRRLIPSQRMIENASPEVFEDESPDHDHLRATFGKMVCQYINAARNKVADGLVSEITLNSVAHSVIVMREAWAKTKYFGNLQPNFVIKTTEEITAPAIMPENGSKRPAMDLSMMTDHHLELPQSSQPRTSSPINPSTPAPLEDGFRRPEGAPRRSLPNLTPKAEVKMDTGDKDAEVNRWLQRNAATAADGAPGASGVTGAPGAPGAIGATGVSGVANVNGNARADPANPGPLFSLNPNQIRNMCASEYGKKLKEEREAMEKRMKAEIAKAIEETNNAARKHIEKMQEDQQRLLQSANQQAECQSTGA